MAQRKRRSPLKRLVTGSIPVTVSMHKELLALLINGQPLMSYREGGNSMVPIIKSRQPVTIYPVDTSQLEVGDIVVARVKGRIFQHLISAIDGDRIQISNNHGHVNGWTNREKVYGIVTAVGDKELPGAVRKTQKTPA